MRSLLLSLLALVALAAPAAAQVPVLTDPSTQGYLVWSQLSAAGTFDRFEVSVVATGQPAAYTSIGLPTPTAGVYRFKLPATLVDGNYTAAVRTCLSTANPQCSAGVGAAFVVARPQTPPTPTNFQIVLTIADGQVANVRLVPQP